MDSYQRVLRISISRTLWKRKGILIDYKDMACSAAYLMTSWDNYHGFKDTHFFTVEI